MTGHPSRPELHVPLLLDKVLGQLAQPLGVAAGVGLLALLMLAVGRRGRAALLLVFGVAWLWCWSMPLTANAVVDYLTAGYPPRRVEALPTSDAIVLLGGTVDPAAGRWVYPDLNGGADRIWHAARLYHAGKAPLIVVSAGNVWGGPERESEAVATRILLDALGVPESAVVVEASSRTTRENATHTAAIAGARGLEQVLLVTSAWHMPRAAAAFDRVGLDVVPAPADYARMAALPDVLRFLPHAEALHLSSRVLREYLGLLVYRLRGWA